MLAPPSAVKRPGSSTDRQVFHACYAYIVKMLMQPVRCWQEAGASPREMAHNANRRQAVSAMNERAIAHLTALADLSLPEDRLERVSIAFSPLLAAAHELNHKMSAEEMRDI